MSCVTWFHISSSSSSSQLFADLWRVADEVLCLQMSREVAYVKLFNHSSSSTSSQRSDLMMDKVSCSIVFRSTSVSNGSRYSLQTQKAPSFWHQRISGAWIWVVDHGHQSLLSILLGCAAGVEELFLPDIPTTSVKMSAVCHPKSFSWRQKVPGWATAL